MEPYHQLTQEHRYQIYALRKTGHSSTEIAGVMESIRAQPVARWSATPGECGYRPQRAHQQALRRITARMWRQVERLLQREWSPEQIVGHLQREHNFRISHEWIYQHILQEKRAGGDLYHHLRCQKIYHKRYGRAERRGNFSPGRSIAQRPAMVEQRRRLRDWDADATGRC